MNDIFIHDRALVETKNVGKGTRIWAFAHIMDNVIIQEDCNIGDHVFIESGVRIGRGVTIKNGVSIWEGVEIADHVFIGPNVVFTNDLFPRSPRSPAASSRYSDKLWLQRTFIDEGASIGANATILCGIRIGKYCMVGAGSVVTRDVPPYRLVYGCPARARGYVNKQGELLERLGRYFIGRSTKKKYVLKNNEMSELE
jgi:acetyltransferase-like isoleucine patch superfamily enzyme